MQVSPCALAISTTANACLSQTDVWGVPVPLGAALIVAGVSFLLGILAVLAAQAAVCTCLVSVRVILCGFARSEVKHRVSGDFEQQVVGRVEDHGAQTIRTKGDQPPARGRDLPRLRR